MYLNLFKKHQKQSCTSLSDKYRSKAKITVKKSRTMKNQTAVSQDTIFSVRPVKIVAENIA